MVGNDARTDTDAAPVWAINYATSPTTIFGRGTCDPGSPTSPTGRTDKTGDMATVDTIAVDVWDI